MIIEPRSYNYWYWVQRLTTYLYCVLEGIAKSLLGEEKKKKRQTKNPRNPGRWMAAKKTGGERNEKEKKFCTIEENAPAVQKQLKEEKKEVVEERGSMMCFYLLVRFFPSPPVCALRVVHRKAVEISSSVFFFQQAIVARDRIANCAASPCWMNFFFRFLPSLAGIVIDDEQFFCCLFQLS